MDEKGKLRLEEIKEVRKETHQALLGELLVRGCIESSVMLDVAIWKLACDTHSETSDREERKQLVMKEIEKCFGRWI